MNTQHFGHFGQGLEEVKHSIRQDESFGGQRHQNGNSRQYSDSRQYDLQNERKSDKDYVLVSKTAQNGYKPEQIVINQMEVIRIRPILSFYHRKCAESSTTLSFTMKTANKIDGTG